MSQKIREYFALEAGEYLDRLDALLTGEGAPDFGELHRLARSVRGSARVAGADGIAETAGVLEGAARALRDGRLEWDESVRTRAVRTVDDLRVLVRADEPWGDDEEARARAVEERWADAQAASPAAPEHGADRGRIFSFVADEIAAIADEVDRAASGLAGDPAGREPLRSLLKRMRPVRGVTGMAPLAPVVEVLEGIEDTVQELLVRAAPAAEAALDALRAAGAALRAARDPLARGEPPVPDSALEHFRSLRDGAFAAGEEGVVEVSALFAAEGPHVVRSPVAPAPGGEGDATGQEAEPFLRIRATGLLDRAEGMVASAVAGDDGVARVARQLAALAVEVRELARTYQIPAVAAAADAAAARLVEAEDADAAHDALDALRDAIPGGPGAAERVGTVGTVERDAPADEPASAASGGADEDGVIPIESLLYAPDDALRAALALRPKVESLAGGGDDEADDVVDELFALVELGLGRAS